MVLGHQKKRNTSLLMVLIVAVLMSLTMTGCLPTQKEKPMTVVMEAYSPELARFIPDKPFSGQYTGTGNYSHMMSVADVIQTDASKVYRVKGEVRDLSSGPSGMDFNIGLTYTVSVDEIRQDKKAPAMLDSEFDSLVILKMPVKKGASWEQPVVYSDGRKSKLKAFISDVAADSAGGGRIVTIDYKDEANQYLEKRKIQEGRGIVEFQKDMNFEGSRVELGYKLETVDVTAPEAPETAQGTEVAAGPGKEDQAIGDAVRAFDNAWIDFVNNKSISIYDTLIKDGQAYKLVKSFRQDGSKQRFEEIRIKGVTVLESKAQAKVYERIRQTKGDQTRTLVYNWIYHLKKVEGRWYIDYYEQDQSPE